MPTLSEYFQNDFKGVVLDHLWKVSIGSQVYRPFNNEFGEIEIEQRLLQHSESSARFFTFYIPHTKFTFAICQSILNGLSTRISAADKITFASGFVADKTLGNHAPVYSNRIYFYTEDELEPTETVGLEQIARAKNLFLTLRSQGYLRKKMEIQKPLAFISHDSRDKESIATPIANGLNSRLSFVWYDEYALKVGDSLRASIEDGIKKAKKCVLILTPNFLNNSGWTKTEFNSIFTRELIFNEKIVLPIWFNVSKEDIYNYSPSLADTVALIWPIRADFANEIDYNKEIEKIISKLHTQITN